jgi:penicillin-binding protein 1A
MIWFYNKILGFIVLFLTKVFLKIDIDLKNKYEILQLKIKNIHCITTPELIHIAVIAMEDRRFFDHLGFDFISIIRAFKNNLGNHPIQGASTIEQQLVRTLINERKICYSRKLIEIGLATLICNKFKKKELLEYYLNSYPFKNCIGIEELCTNDMYNINSLNIYDVSEIVARVKYPSVSINNYVRYLKRVRTTQIKLGFLDVF